MNISADDSKEQVFDDMRRQLARQARIRDERARTVFGVLRACIVVTSGLIAELLESRIIVALAVCLSAVLVALLIQGPQKNAKLSADLVPTSRIEEAVPAGNVEAGRVNNGDEFVAVPTGGNSRSNSESKEAVGSANEVFLIKVGAFRDASNVKRVVERLRKETIEVRTEVLGNGLYVVTLGPFAGRDAAEEIARSVHDAIGLVPTVFRQDLE